MITQCLFFFFLGISLNMKYKKYRKFHLLTLVSPDCGRIVPSSGCCEYSDSGHLFLLLFADVALIVEVTEEDDECDTVTKHQHIHGIWEIALCEQVVASVQEEQHKLHLERQTFDQLTPQTA